MQRLVDGYNENVNALRTEIEVQKKYQSKIENLQKKHLSGVRGNQ